MEAKLPVKTSQSRRVVGRKFEQKNAKKKRNLDILNSKIKT